MKKITKKEKADIECFKNKMRSVAFIAAAAIVEPQDEISKAHARMAETLLNLLTKNLDDKGKQLIEVRVKAYALKVAKGEL